MTEHLTEPPEQEQKTDRELLSESIRTVIKLGKAAIDNGYDARFSMELRHIANDLGKAHDQAEGKIDRPGRNPFAEHIEASRQSSNAESDTLAYCRNYLESAHLEQLEAQAERAAQERLKHE